MEHLYNIGDWVWGYHFNSDTKWFFQVEKYTVEHEPFDGSSYIMYHDGGYLCCEEYNIEGVLEETSPEVEEYKLYLTLRKKYEGR